MTAPGGETEPSQTRIEAHAGAQARQYVAGRDLTIVTGPVATMRTLPRDVAAFTGRDIELGRLIAAAAAAAGVVTIHTVDGMPGVGKTALVTRAAHLLAGDFPDGQLFVDLHAHTPGMPPADLSEVLAGLLACTGMAPASIPAGVEARAERGRGRLAGQEVLLVLDDAAGHAQVGPLLPGTAGCLVLVTSRHRLIALDGAQALALDTLPPDQAIELFTRLAHRTQDGSDAGTIAELARLCGSLPLAIALLAGRLAHHPSWNITTFTADFVAAQDRLTELAAGDRPGDPAVAAAFQMSYQDLPADRQRLFRRLGLHPGTDIDAYATAALARVPLLQARQDLDALYTDHLIDEPALGRYRLHDLTREYARTLATRHDPADDRGQATGQLLDYYQHTAQTADHHLTRLTRPGMRPATTALPAAPDLPDRARALAWMRTERANLLACIGYATTQAQPARIIALTAALGTFLLQEGPWHQAATLHHTAAITAHQLGDRLGEANALHELGRIRYMTGDYLANADLQERALAIYQDLGSRLGEANTLHDLGHVRSLAGDYPAAADLQERALAIYQDLGSRIGEAGALNDLGRVRSLAGDYLAAADLQERALAIYQDLGDRIGEAGALYDLGRVRSVTGDYLAAAGWLERALAIYQDLGSRLGKANALHDLGRVRSLAGDYPVAADLLERALALFRELGNAQGEAEALNSTGALMAESAGPQKALAVYRQALQLARQIHSPLDEARALEGAARCMACTGDQAAALTEAIAIYQRIGAAEAVTATAYLATLKDEVRDDTSVSNRPIPEQDQ